MKNLKFLIGAAILMSLFSCEIDELPNDQVTDEELEMNLFLEGEQSVNRSFMLPIEVIDEGPEEEGPIFGVGDQHDTVEDRKGSE